MAGKLPTTVIGSFPKPDYLPIRDWFDSSRDNGTMGSTDVTLGYTEWKAPMPTRRCSAGRQTR